MGSRAPSQPKNHQSGAQQLLRGDVEGLGCWYLVAGRGRKKEPRRCIPPSYIPGSYVSLSKRTVQGFAPWPLTPDWPRCSVSPTNFSASVDTVTSSSFHPCSGVPLTAAVDNTYFPFLSPTCTSLSKNSQPSRKRDFLVTSRINEVA